MNKYVKLLVERLFDDDDVFGDEESTEIYSDMLNAQLLIIINKLKQGISVSNADLNLACMHPYEVADKEELEHIVFKTYNNAIENNIEEVNLNWINIKNVDDLTLLLQVTRLKPIFIDVSNWNTGHVKNMSYLFLRLTNICDLSKWDVSSVEDMGGMFNKCKNFDLDLSNWKVNNVKNFANMFNECSKFNGTGLLNWKTTAANNMYHMFEKCSNLNADLSQWDVSNVTVMSNMFYSCPKFNSDISNWQLCNKGVIMDKMFYSCSTFNAPIGKWNIQYATNITSILEYCKSFKLDLSNWDIRNIHFCNDFINSLVRLPANYMPKMYLEIDFIILLLKKNIMDASINLEYYYDSDSGFSATIDDVYLDEGVIDNIIEKGRNNIIYIIDPCDLLELSGIDIESGDNDEHMLLNMLGTMYSEYTSLYKEILLSDFLEDDYIKENKKYILDSLIYDYLFNSSDLDITEEDIIKNSKKYYNDILNYFNITANEFEEMYPYKELIEKLKKMPTMKWE